MEKSFKPLWINGGFAAGCLIIRINIHAEADITALFILNYN